LAFGPARGRVRTPRFVPRAGVPIDAACVVANGVREALRALLGDACPVTLGEPVVLDAPAWSRLTGDALVFAAPGRATDVAFVIAARDARRLVQAAFGEDLAGGEPGWSALETGALERIVARCAVACDALCVERRGPASLVEAARLGRPVAYFDVRLGPPLGLCIGVGLLRELPEPPAVVTLAPAALASVGVDVRVVLGHAVLPLTEVLTLRTGSVVPLRTKVGGGGELNLAGQRIAFGSCGVRNGRAAFEVGSIAMRGDAP
jgi:hypothetical protein